ncbi:MAG: DUF1643 domain-containing protein [Clostridia bacterium]|nr:DUF1643 domain-containing protein [Clostridia bacterium]
MRHIPSGETSGAAVLSFEEALVPTGADFDRSRWLYVPDHYSEYRYILGTLGKRPLVCVGVNPSTAVPGRLDNTLKSAERVARFNGFDSFIMFNVYAQRATVPDDMDRTLNPVLHRENMKAFAWVLDRLPAPPAVWAAWGAVIEKRPWLPACVLDMVAVGKARKAAWLTAGPRSRAGHPHHPLYLKKDSPLEAFADLEPYLLGLQKKLAAGPKKRNLLLSEADGGNI